MKRRIREKLAVKRALASPTIMLGDVHSNSKDHRLYHKIRRALEKQVHRGQRRVISVGDVFEMTSLDEEFR